MRRVTWTDQGNQMEGWFHQFVTVGDGDGVLAPFAIVELDNGAVEVIQVGMWESFRFVNPHKPHGDWKPGSFAEIERELSEAELQDCDCVLPEHACESCVKHAGENEIVY